MNLPRHGARPGESLFVVLDRINDLHSNDKASVADRVGALVRRAMGKQANFRTIARIAELIRTLSPQAATNG